MNTFKNAGNTLKGIVLGLVLVVAGAYVYAWTGPTQAPPNGNVEAPINTSDTPQTKRGDLTVTSKVTTGTLVGSIGNIGLVNSDSIRIGSPSSPGYLLDVAGRIRLRHGAGGTPKAGIWFADQNGNRTLFFGALNDTDFEIAKIKPNCTTETNCTLPLIRINVGQPNVIKFFGDLKKCSLDGNSNESCVAM